MASQAQKRSASEQQNLLEGVKAVIVDIEGTTTPISFVHDKLFGYVKDNLKDYLSTRWENEDVQTDVEALRNQANSDKEDNVDGVVEIAGKDEEQEKAVQSVVDNVLWQMDNDRKSTGLKQLQGHMWREAYKTGKVVGEVYDDVVDALKALTKSERQVYVYSSGSVDAQKLLFGYSDKGDLQEYFEGYFDTTSGDKNCTDSYKTIVKKIGVSAGETLFLTDVPREAAPAVEAGLKVALVVREGNTALTQDEKKTYNTITSFSELFSSEEDEEDGEPPAKKAAPAEAEDKEAPAKKAAPAEDKDESNGAAEDDDDVEDLDEDEVDEEDLGDEEEDEAAE